MAEPREWWIAKASGDMIYSRAYSVRIMEETFHVIEYSALEAAIAQRDEARADLASMVNHASEKSNQFNNQIAAANAKVKELEGELANLKGNAPEDFLTPYENELLAKVNAQERQITRLVEALEFYVHRHGKDHATVAAKALVQYKEGK